MFAFNYEPSSNTSQIFTITVHEFVTNIYSPSWWIGVVLASFAINLGSAYAKPGLDRLWARYSTTRRGKLAQNQEKMLQQVSHIISQPDGIVLLALEDLKAILGAVLCFTVCSVLILSLFFLGGAIRILIFVAVLLFLLVGLTLMHVATRKTDLLRLARERRAKV